MIFAMATCHSVIPEKNEETGEVFFNSSSPDEAALVNGAKFLGAEFADRTEDNNIIVKFQKQTYKYKLIYLFEFNSDRKRMSVVVKDKDNKAKLITKGADIVIFDRIKKNEAK
jgi:magnesium-transporting ATPase (P-type)